MNIKREMYGNTNKNDKIVNCNLWLGLIMVVIIINFNVMEKDNDSKIIHIQNIHENYENWYLRHEY